jgi:AcrR family transcriptional regulator
MRAEGDLTHKGELRAAEILAAAVRCLGTDGYAATSLQRVADEARLSKRVVLYYYGSRAGLFDHVVRHIGDRLVQQLEESIVDLVEPEDLIERGFRTFWSAIATDRALLVAWLGLQTEALTNPEFLEPAGYITGRLRAFLGAVMDGVLERGLVLRLDRTTLEILVLATVQGLILNYVEGGDTPELQAAITAAESLLADAAFDPAQDAAEA